MLDLPVIYNEDPAQEQAINACIAEAAEAYQINPLLLRAIREQERGDLGMKNLNDDGSYDLGPFQINTIHLEDLRYFGITEDQVRNDPCFNTAAAAWHLRNKINENDGDIWKGVAWYHSKTDHLGTSYRAKVVKKFRALTRKIKEAFGGRNRVADSGDY